MQHFFNFYFTLILSQRSLYVANSTGARHTFRVTLGQETQHSMRGFHAYRYVFSPLSAATQIVRKKNGPSLELVKEFYMHRER